MCSEGPDPSELSPLDPSLLALLRRSSTVSTFIIIQILSHRVFVLCIYLGLSFYIDYTRAQTGAGRATFLYYRYCNTRNNLAQFKV